MDYVCKCAKQNECKKCYGRSKTKSTSMMLNLFILPCSHQRAARLINKIMRTCSYYFECIGEKETLEQNVLLTPNSNTTTTTAHTLVNTFAIESDQNFSQLFLIKPDRCIIALKYLCYYECRCFEVRSWKVFQRVIVLGESEGQCKATK